MRFWSLLLGVSEAGQDSDRSGSPPLKHSTKNFTSGTDPLFVSDQDTGVTATDLKNEEEVTSSPDQHDKKSDKGGIIAGITQKVFLPLNVNLWEDDTKTVWISLIVISGVLMLLCLCGFFCSMFSRQRGRDRQRRQFKSLFGYLNAMDMEDLDIRRSPAGGFHISYLNGLSKGEKTPTIASEDDESSSDIDSNGPSSQKALSTRI